MKKKLINSRSFVLLLLLALFLLSMSVAGNAQAFGTIILDFAGLTRAQGAPRVPDMTGDVGLNQYIQAVNLEIAIYDKFTGAPGATTDFDTFFEQAAINGSDNAKLACDEFNRGQPQVFFDHMSQRWLITDIAYEDVDDGPYFQCIAISKSDSPPTLTSADWFQYGFEIHSDYRQVLPKFGVWPDGFYMAADLYDVWNNGIHATPKGVTVWAFNRNDLIAGNPTPATQDFYISESFGYQGLLPSNLLGDPPPAGTPNYFASVAPPNKFYTWEFKVDWINTSNSSFTGPKTTIVNTFSWPSGFLAPQLGSAENLNIHGQRLMQPLQYRYKVDGQVRPSLWANHTVGNGSTIGIRWYEMRNLSGTPVAFQQGTYIDPADSAYRWLGSLAVDGQGNMALAYNKSSSQMFPAIYQTGRLATDPLGKLQPEMVFRQGTGPQDLTDPDTTLDGPWGRYSHMTVDPYNECEFWYVGEYYDEGTPEIWRTWITKFSLVECEPINQGYIVRESLSTDNDEAFGGGSGVYSTAISGDGRYVVFESEADTLVPNDTNGHVDVFLRDRDSDGNGIYDEPGGVTTTRISMGYDGAQANADSGVGVTGDFGGNSLSISRNGRYVVYSSEASNLVPNDTNGTFDVFRYDRVTGTTTRVSLNSSGTQGNAVSDQPSISRDGRYVAFRSFANNLVTGDTNTVSDIFVRDMVTGTTVRVSVDSLGAEADGPSYTPMISPSTSGRFVVFASDATNLVAGDTNNRTDIFLHDRDVSGDGTPDQAGDILTERASLSDGGAQLTGRSFSPSVSADGLYVAFASAATNAVAGDTNGVIDIFLRDRSTPTTLRLSVDQTGGVEANRRSFRPSISADGMYVAFETAASNLLPGDMNGLRDIYVADRTDPRELRKVTFGYDGTEANGDSFWPALSEDGRHTVFASDANNLVRRDTNNLRDVFVHDREAEPPPGPTLIIPQEEIDPVYAAEKVEVPVRFESNGNDISSLSFALDLNNPCFALDPTDSDSDGVPDDVDFNLPGGYAFSVVYDSTNVTLQMAAYDPVSPLGALPDGTIVTVKLLAICQPPVGSSQFVEIGFANPPQATFGNTDGESVPGTTKSGAIEILYNPAGDCNADGVVDAGDMSSLILEIYDGDGNLAVNTPGGTFPGNERGCDSNRDSLVDAGDISCTILIIFNGFNGLLECVDATSFLPTGLAAAAPQNSTAVPKGFTIQGDIEDVLVALPRVSAAPGDMIDIPVTFDPDGHNITSLVFSIDLDESLLTFDAADADDDGVPDSVTLNVPAGYVAGVTYDATDRDGELDVIIYDFNSQNGAIPLPAGEILSFKAEVAQVEKAANAELRFSHDPPASFGDDKGQSVPNRTQDGAVVITTGNNELLLPVVIR